MEVRGSSDTLYGIYTARRSTVMFSPADRGYLRRPVDLPDASPRSRTLSGSSRSPSPGIWQQSDLLPFFIDSVEDYAIYALDADGNVATWNRGAHGVKGYTAEAILGRPVATFYPPDDVASGKPERDLADRGRRGASPRGGMAGPQGRLVLLGQRARHRAAGPGWAVGRIRQGERDLTERRRGDDLYATAKNGFACWSTVSPTTRSSCSTRKGSCRAGTSAPSV